MRIDVLTLFPEFFQPLTQSGVTGRAHGRGLWQLHAWNPRDFTHDVHRTVDDRPFGGGPGMIMRIDPLVEALQAVRAARDEVGALAAPVVLLSPAGRRFDQSRARSLAGSAGAVLVCGRYEGVDQRFIDRYVDEQWSLGDFVLSGGEPAAMPMIDAAVRLLPGALNHRQSAAQDSFDASLSGLLDCPHYTRPEVHEGDAVPPVLMSGHHQHIARWRREQSLVLTQRHRPDLIDQARERGWLDAADEAVLARIGAPEA